MKFIKLGRDWYEFDIQRMRAINYNCGHFDIDENSPEYIEAKLGDFVSWHDLYLETDYDPLIGEVCHCGWISPYGDFYPAEAHAVTAADICDILYGLDFDDIYDASSYLHKRGWVRVTTGVLMEYYIRDGEYDNVRKEQYFTLTDWAQKYAINELTERSDPFADATL